MNTDRFNTMLGMNRRAQLVFGVAIAAALGLFTLPRATYAQAAATQVQDPSVLRPPAGARVAIVEFDDLECPACATANPTLKAASEKYKIPWVRHDYLIPYHKWSRNAAINARWFDTRSKALGDEYRDQCFANQSSIYNPDVLNTFTQKFAKDHGIALPFAIDPQGKLAADVNADIDLGKRVGIRSTPTIYIVTSGSKGAAYIQVQKPAQDLYSTIDQAMADTKAAPAPAHSPAVHKN